MSSDDTTRPDGTVADSPAGNVVDTSGRASDGIRSAPLRESSVGDPGERPVSPSGRFTSLRTLWLNAAALAVVLVAGLALMHPSSVIVPDEGVYLAQADALSQGSWRMERLAIDVDPEGELDRLSSATILGDYAVPYARHALYPVLLTPFFWLGDYGGTLILSVIGAWGTAVSAAFLARRLDHRYGVWALWMVGIGSPVFFYGFITMAHGLAAAAAGLTVLGVTSWLDDQRWTALLYAVPAAAATVLLRTEGVVFVLSFGLAVGILALNFPGARGIKWVGVGTSLALGIVGAGFYILDTRIDHAITGMTGYGVDPARIATRNSANPLAGSWASLFRPFEESWDTASVWTPLVPLSVVLASISLRLAPKRTLLPLGFLLGGAVAGIATAITPPLLITGLFAAFPVLVAGLIWIRKVNVSIPLVSRTLLGASLCFVGIVGTLYEVGGGTEWGGRFFLLLIPVLTPLVVMGLHNAARSLSRNELRLAAACLILISLSLSVTALRSQLAHRRIVSDIVVGTKEFVRDHVKESDPIVLTANLYPNGGARFFWRPDPSMEVLAAYNLQFLGKALGMAHDAGRSSVVVSTNVSPGLFATAMQGPLNELGWEVLDASLSPQGYQTVILIGDPSST